LILSEGKKTNTRYFLTHFISYKQEKRKDEVLLYIRDRVYSEHGEVISLSDVNQLFQNYSLYIDTEDHIYVGIDAFLLWCMDKRHDFSSRIREKAYEYFTLLGSIEYRRNKHGFFDAIFYFTMFSHFLMDMVEHGLLSNSYMENKTVMKYC
jgi:hypothetical protein